MASVVCVGRVFLMIGVKSLPNPLVLMSIEWVRLVLPACAPGAGSKLTVT